MGISWLIYGRKAETAKVDPLKKGLGPVFTGMERKWWVDEFYQAILLNPYKASRSFMAEQVDLGVIDRIGGGLAAGTRVLAEGIRKIPKWLHPHLRVVDAFGSGCHHDLFILQVKDSR